MLETLVVAFALLAAPAALVVGLLLILGTAVAGMTDGTDHALARPNPS